MHYHSSLSLQLESCDQQRQSGRSIGALNRHSQKSGRFVENDHGIVFVEHGRLPGEARPAPVFRGRQLSPTAASLSQKFFHWPGAETISPLSNHSADIANLKIGYS